MKNLLYTLLAILLFGGVAVGSELTIVVAEHDATQSSLSTVDTEVGIIDDTLDARATYLWQHIRLEIDFDAGGPWEEETPHEFMIINGSVEFQMTAYCSTDVAGTDSLVFFFPLTAERALSFKGTDIDAGEVIIGLSTTAAYDPNLIDPGPKQEPVRLGYGQWWEGVIHGISGAVESWNYDIDGGALTGGIIIILVRWRPCIPGSNSTMAVGTGV